MLRLPPCRPDARRLLAGSTAALMLAAVAALLCLCCIAPAQAAISTCTEERCLVGSSEVFCDGTRCNDGTCEAPTSGWLPNQHECTQVDEATSSAVAGLCLQGECIVREDFCDTAEARGQSPCPEGGLVFFCNIICSGGSCNVRSTTATTCTDNDPSTVNDTCVAGICQGVSIASSSTAPPAASGDTCSELDLPDQHLCTINSTIDGMCLDSKCVSMDEFCSRAEESGRNPCPAEGSTALCNIVCDSGTCIVFSGASHTCDDGDVATVNDTCSTVTGLCSGQAPPPTTEKAPTTEEPTTAASTDPCSVNNWPDQRFCPLPSRGSGMCLDGVCVPTESFCALAKEQLRNPCESGSSEDFFCNIVCSSGDCNFVPNAKTACNDFNATTIDDQCSADTGLCEGRMANTTTDAPPADTTTMPPAEEPTTTSAEEPTTTSGDGSSTPSAAVRQAAARFGGLGGVQGSITFRQPDLGRSGVNVTVILTGLDGHAGGYHVHVVAINGSSDGLGSSVCGSTGGHFDPSQSKTLCTAAIETSSCEAGDLSGKHGSLAGLDSYVARYADAALSLSGADSVVGRSVVIHFAANASRWVCANIVAEPLTAPGALPTTAAPETTTAADTPSSLATTPEPATTGDGPTTGDGHTTGEGPTTAAGPAAGNPCPAGQVSCADNTTCILATQLCDGFADCDDGTDERPPNCPDATSTLTPTASPTAMPSASTVPPEIETTRETTPSPTEAWTTTPPETTTVPSGDVTSTASENGSSSISTVGIFFLIVFSVVVLGVMIYALKTPKGTLGQLAPVRACRNYCQYLGCCDSKPAYYKMHDDMDGEEFDLALYPPTG